jgi:hypothetical protein
MGRAQELVETARARVMTLPATPARGALLAFGDFVLERRV